MISKNPEKVVYMENFSKVYGFHGLYGFHGFIGLLVCGFHELIALLVSGYIARISGPFKIKQILLTDLENQDGWRSVLLFRTPQTISLLRIWGSPGLPCTKINGPYDF